MFSIAIIKPNTLNLTPEHFLNPNSEELKTALIDCVTFKNVQLPDLMKTIVEEIGLTQELIGSTSLCHETPENMFELCYLNMLENGDVEDPSNVNHLATYLVRGNFDVYRTCVLLKNKIGDNLTRSPDNLTYKDLLQACKTKAIHRGIKIHPDGTYEEFSYDKDPMENFSQEEIASFRWCECQFLKSNLILFIKPHANSSDINKLASNIYGRKRINGPALLILKSDENDFLDLDRITFEKFLAVSSGPYGMRMLDEEEKNETKLNKLPVIKNQYHILNKRFDKFNAVYNNEEMLNKLNQHRENNLYNSQSLNQLVLESELEPQED